MFNKRNNNFARAAKFLVHFLLTFLHDYDVQFPNAMFYGGRDRKMNFSFSAALIHNLH